MADDKQFRVISVDPIEGTIVDLFKDVVSKLPSEKKISSIKELKKVYRAYLDNCEDGEMQVAFKIIVSDLENFEAGVRERIKWCLGQADAYRQYPFIEEPNALWREDEAIALYWMLTGKEISAKELRRVLGDGKSG